VGALLRKSVLTHSNDMHAGGGPNLEKLNLFTSLSPRTFGFEVSTKSHLYVIAFSAPLNGSARVYSEPRPLGHSNRDELLICQKWDSHG